MRLCYNGPMKKTLLIIIAVLILAIIGVIVTIQMSKREPGKGTDIGIEFPIPVTDANQTISVSLQTSGQVVKSPIIVSGEARGNWYFEASFPVVLVDWDGRIIAEGHAQAEGDWMTTGFVPFTATLTFTKPADTGAQSARGALILKKDNPSGLPKNDASIEIPVKFR